MNQRKSLGRKTVDKIDPTKLTELILTDVDREDFNRGIRLFNEGKFWHAHEAWEQVWHRHPEDSRLFIQGLIQIAAGFHLLIEKRRYSGATSNFNKALARLRLFEPTFLDLQVASFIEAIERAKDKIQRLEETPDARIDHTVVPVIAYLPEQ
jgi:tetratricopeptide (TPR) repeat protein